MKKSKEKREVSIDNKIFTKDDIISLIKLFNKLSNEILDKSKKIKREELIRKGCKESSIEEKDIDNSNSSLELISSDNSTYTASLDQILDEDAIFSNKKITEINLYFTECVLDSQFKIRIMHSGSSSSYVSVEGQDRAWVNGTIRLIEDFLSNCRNQSTFVKKFQILIIALTILILMLFLLNLIELFIKTQLPFPKIVANLFTKDLIFFLIVLSLITATPAIFIYEWLKKLFPRIEIQTGKDFQKIESEKRKKLWIITSIIVIPTIISFLLRLL
jgi:hypothetical protein